MEKTDLTPVAVFTQLASLVFGMSVAMVVGPYIVIVIGAMGGAAVAIMHRPSTGKARAFIYFVAMTSLSVLLTVPLSMMVSSMWPSLQEHWLFAPLSFALGYCGDKMPAIMSAIGAKVSAFIDILIQLRGTKP